MDKMRIGVLTAGGDCPGLNAGIGRLITECGQRGWTLVGIRNGFVGLMTANRHPDVATIPLLGVDTADLSRRGGTWLGSIRSNFDSHNDRLDAAIGGVQRLKLDGLVVFGGNGSLRNAISLTDVVPVAGIPKTIDNDIAGTDTAIGFATAVESGVRHLDALDDTARSHGTRFLVEVMGRRSGALAASIAQAAAVDGVLIPEADARVGELAARLSRGSRSLVVVAEGAWCADLGVQPTNRTGATKVGGIVDRLAPALGEVKGLRQLSLGHLLRGGAPVAADRLLAQRAASVAAAALADGEQATMVAVRSGQVIRAVLDAAAVATRAMSPAEVADLGALLIGRAR